MDSVIFILHDRQPRKRNPKLLSYTSKVFFNILISKLRKIKKLFVELKQGTLKKGLIRKDVRQHDPRKKGSHQYGGNPNSKAIHLQAWVAESELFSQGKKDDLPRESLSKDAEVQGVEITRDSPLSF